MVLRILRIPREGSPSALGGSPASEASMSNDLAPNRKRAPGLAVVTTGTRAAMGAPKSNNSIL